jgi:hypothetical protein
MRFLGYTIGDPSAPIAPPSPEMFAEMAAFMEEATKAGVLLATGGVGPAEEITKVIRQDGKITVVDGPFTEAKELIGGYWIIQVKSREEAIEWAKRAPAPHGPHQDSEIELRQFFEMDDFAPSEAVDRARELGKQLEKKK